MKPFKKFGNNKAYFHTSARLNMDINSLLELMPIENYTNIIEPVISNLKQAKAAFESSAHHYELRNMIISDNHEQFLHQHYISSKSAENQAAVSQRQGNFLWDRIENQISELRQKYGTPTMEKLEARHTDKGLECINSEYAKAYQAKEGWKDAASNQLLTPSIYRFTDR